MPKELSDRTILKKLREENDQLIKDLKAMTDKQKSSETYEYKYRDELERCHKLLDTIPYAPIDKANNYYGRTELSVRIMGTLLAAERHATEPFCKTKDD